MKFFKLISRNLNFIFKRNYNTPHSTIYALSSGYGKCGVAVIRVSGPQSGSALMALSKLKTLPHPRMALLRKIYNPVTSDVLDRGLILWFPAPNSFTGEDCCEFQVHGSVAVISAILKSLSTFQSVRPAEPGEFTKRAFLSGKLDLTEVEGLADLLQAETELQRKQAYLQTEGVLSKIYNNWRNTLVKSLANIEAFIDFEETESLDNDILNGVFDNVQQLQESISKHIETGRRGEILRSGVKTVIVGEPNVGKSSLLNNLCAKPKAIVSPIEGTTRDLLEVTMDINGYPLILTDTAGLRNHTSDTIEQEGMRRAIESIRTANFILFVMDANKLVHWYTSSQDDFQSYSEEYLKNLQLGSEDLLDKRYVIIFNKSDLIDSEHTSILGNIAEKNENVVLTSCTRKIGLDNLVTKMTKELEILCGNPSREHPSMSQERHKNHLISCTVYLNQFVQHYNSENSDVVLMAQDLRQAMRQLGKLTGAVTTEDLLDVIFKDFCIGK